MRAYYYTTHFTIAAATAYTQANKQTKNEEEAEKKNNCCCCTLGFFFSRPKLLRLWRWNSMCINCIRTIWSDVSRIIGLAIHNKIKPSSVVSVRVVICTFLFDVRTECMYLSCCRSFCRQLLLLLLPLHLFVVLLSHADLCTEHLLRLSKRKSTLSNESDTFALKSLRTFFHSYPCFQFAKRFSTAFGWFGSHHSYKCIRNTENHNQVLYESYTHTHSHTYN